ncbi:hypothetical protein HDU80_009835 [Chytriomyces hyalinus]|nr:hypothetical protein HDU80_009835 [Chytriomyces hyalinus]
MSFLFAHWHHLCLPDEWQVWLNRIYTVQSLILIGYCAIRRAHPHAPLASGSRWFLGPNAPSNHWVFRQYNTMLWAHAVYYAVELLFTSMLTKYSIMAVHHIFAIAMALGSLTHQNTLSVFCTIPLLIHNIMWASNIHSFALLALYNIATFINASCMYVSICALQVQARAVNAPILVAVSIAIVFNNYFLYCHNLKGQFCVRWDPFMWIEGDGGAVVVADNDDPPQDGGAFGSGAYRGVMLWIVLFWACWMALLHLGASLLKERWARNPPSFAVKPDEYLSVSESEEAFMHEGTNDKSEDLEHGKKKKNKST